MRDSLRQNTVLVLNRNWQAIHTLCPAEAFCRMATNTAVALDVRGPDWMVPVSWEEWLDLPIAETDQAVGTPMGQIRVPTVVIMSSYALVPMKRPKFNSRNLWQRDDGCCQYTGRQLRPGEGSIDHVIPRSRGGSTSWENCVLAAREVNAKKADRTPEEAGLKLQRKPVAPREVPVTKLLKNQHEIPSWELFLGKEDS